MFIPNHLHLIVKGTIKNPPTEVDVLNKWFIELVEKVRMVVVAGPTSVYVHEEGNEGLTGTVTLATSHASIHIWEKYEPSMFQFDIYSCSCFTAEEVLAHLDEFGLIKCEYILIDRNGDKMVIIEDGSK
jgi:S-adenosylmethionine/arginine decarboxylase-like enzyme